jgi:putative ABC transport system permease protein
MMVSVDLANQSASRAFTLSANAVAGKATHRIVGGPSSINEDLYRRLRTDAGYPLVAPIVESYVVADGLGGRLMRLIGIDPFAEPPFRDYFGSGSGPTRPGEGGDDLTAFLTEPNTVFLAEPLAAEFGLELGDTFGLTIAGRAVTVRLAGLLVPQDDAARRALSGLIFSDIATAQPLFSMAGRLSYIDVIADEAGLATIQAILPPDARLEPTSAGSNAIQQMTAAFELNLTALSLLALVVGMFLIYNTVTFSVVQRRPLFGVLRCLGVTGGQLFGLIVIEAAGLSLVGALLGLGLGIALGRSMVALVAQTINDFYFVVNVQEVTISAGVLVKGLVVGLLAAIAAALLPALEAMRIPPQSALRRSTLESRARRIVPWLLLAWLLLAGLGAFLLWLPGINLLISFAGLFIVLIAFALLTPPLTLAAMSWLGPTLGRLFGPLGRLAPRDIVRSISRTSVAVAALMVAVSVIVGVSIMIGSFRQTVDRWLADTLLADIFLAPPTLTASQPQGALDPAVVAEVAAWPGIEEVVSARNVQALAPELGRAIELVVVDGDVSRGGRQYAWADGAPDSVWPRLLAGEGVLVSEPLLVREGLPIPPPPLTLVTDSGPRSFPVLGVFYDYSSDRGSVMIGRTTYNGLWSDRAITTLGLFVAPGQSAEAIVADLEERYRGRADVVIQSNAAVRSNALDIFDRTFAITAALQLLATVVAFIGVLSALLSLQLERDRELGVLRATGMTLGQLWRLILLETGLMGGMAGLLAMPTGWVLAWILIYVINRRSFGWTLTMALEPEHFLQALAVALVAALLAGVYPALRLGRTVIATAVRQE